MKPLKNPLKNTVLSFCNENRSFRFDSYIGMSNMAEGRALNLLYQNVASTGENGCLSSFLPSTSCTELSGMSHDGVRLKWTGDLLELKRIVRELWGLEGKWSSPGGQSKKFSSTNSDLVLTWHKGKLNSVLFKGRDGVLVRDQRINTSVCGSPNLPDENVKVATDFASLVETTQNKTVCRSAPDFVDCQCQTEQIELNSNNCGCSCGIIAAELERMKLELVILQKKFEFKLDSFVAELSTDRTNINQLKQELGYEKGKNSRFESELALFVREGNAEVNKLNKTIALLNDEIKTSVVIIDQLGPLNASKNLEGTCTFNINAQTKNANQKLFNCNDNSCRSSLSGNVNVNKFDEVVEVSNNMTQSTAHNVKTKPALIKRPKTTFDLSLSTWLHAHSYGRKDFLLKDQDVTSLTMSVKLELQKMLMCIPLSI